jgi:hypothetical protein
MEFCTDDDEPRGSWRRAERVLGPCPFLYTYFGLDPLYLDNESIARRLGAKIRK